MFLHRLGNRAQASLMRRWATPTEGSGARRETVDYRYVYPQGNPPRVVIRRVSGVAFPLKTTGSASKSAPPSRLWCARRIDAILCSADSANNNCCLRHLELGA